MLNDQGRNRFYQGAISRSVADKTVVDIGAGTGFLSVLSVQAGASHVWAVEQHPTRAEYLRQVVYKVGMQHKISVVEANFLDCDLPADIYVSETINTQIFGEDIHKIASHAAAQGGQFIPAAFEIYPVIFHNHPIFVLDQNNPDCVGIDPGVEICDTFVDQINQDFLRTHPTGDTLYMANQLNKIFQLLPWFTDIKLQTVWQGDPLWVNLNSAICVDDLRIVIGDQQTGTQDRDWYLVLFWKAHANGLTMDCRDVWFGNVGKTIPYQQRKNSQIQIWYDEVVRNWRLTF